MLLHHLLSEFLHVVALRSLRSKLPQLDLGTVATDQPSSQNHVILLPRLTVLHPRVAELLLPELRLLAEALFAGNLTLLTLHLAGLLSRNLLLTGNLSLLAELTAELTTLNLLLPALQLLAGHNLLPHRQCWQHSERKANHCHDRVFHRLIPYS